LSSRNPDNWGKGLLIPDSGQKHFAKTNNDYGIFSKHHNPVGLANMVQELAEPFLWGTAMVCSMRKHMDVLQCLVML
jgi:hypothetical protein